MYFLFYRPLKQLRFALQSAILSFDMDLELPNIAPRVIYASGSFKLTATMLSSFIVTAVLILFAVIVRVFFLPRWKKDFKHVSRFRMLVEWVVGLFDVNSKDIWHLS